MSIELSRQSSKRIYELILSAKQPSESVREALRCLLRQNIDGEEHSDFLLHRVHWFGPPMSHYTLELQQFVRLYQGRGKMAAKVAYNLLCEALCDANSHSQSAKCLESLLPDIFDKQLILDCLKQNYPHKLNSLQSHECYLSSLLALSKSFPNIRPDLLELALAEFTSFDTEILTGDEWVHHPFVEDEKIIALRSETNELTGKLDTLLHCFLTYLGTLPDKQQILQQVLLIFQHKILPIKTVKAVQLVIFLLSESSKKNCNDFVSFLLGNILDNSGKENAYLIFTQSNFYLISYVARSKILSTRAAVRITLLLIEQLQEKLTRMTPKQVSEHTELYQLFREHEKQLFILQSIVMFSLLRPEIREMIGEDIDRLITACKPILHFEYFFKDEILLRLNVGKENAKGNRVILKYYNKFMPPTLRQVATLIDPLMRELETGNETSLCRECDKKPSKKFKCGPGSLCSQTGI